MLIEINYEDQKIVLFFTHMLIAVIFILGYLLIAFEGVFRISKTAIALITGVLCWVAYIVSSHDATLVSEQLESHLGSISGILFFLLSAMAIVELIDAHDGFDVITSRINTTSERKLLWIVGFISFVLSAILDNLTSTIIMISLLRKLVNDPSKRMMYAGVVIIAANAGGAWTPIGDVTTTMLWIGGQITASNIMMKLIIPSIVCLMVPLTVLSFQMKGRLSTAGKTSSHLSSQTSRFDQKLILISGLLAMIFVPVFKTLTGLPPFMGILFSLGAMWVITELLHKNKKAEEKDVYSVVRALQRTDVPSVLFFLGILIAIAALESTHQLASLASFMDEKIGNINLIVIAIGLVSAVVDNVPLVAASMGMYGLDKYPTDHYFWEFLAYCAGTGGSCLILGSAAGVAAMGMEKMDFFWYLKRFSLLALLGYLAGAGTYILQHELLSGF
jgi:Na+/H+ antiporter NhaD/arsenite permease-like protein